ncbi:hypothetical protein [Nocardia wallacei]|uniref:hypothetical protein n=1 Tax=Nocardia wallacei TaxID=480035 RepID=UPI002457F9BE|nr:hypothetical protein [Nocardia wallacei]
MTVEFPTDQLPIVVEYQAEQEAARHFAEKMAQSQHVAHVSIDNDLSPGLPDMPCERLWT